MINRIIILSKILMLMTLTSCSSQKSNSLDLSQGILGKHINSIIGSDVKIVKNNNSIYGMNTGAVKTTTKEIMNFNGVNLYGFFDENSNFRKNSVKFLFAKKDSIISEYEIITYQTEKSEILIKQLNEFLGKTNFTGYFNAETREKGVFNAKIWEDKVNNYTYLLDVSMQKHGKECWLFIVDNKKEYFYTRAIAVASFSKWEDYIKFKKRFEKPENFYLSGLYKRSNSKRR